MSFPFLPPSSSESSHSVSISNPWTTLREQAEAGLLALVKAKTAEIAKLRAENTDLRQQNEDLLQQNLRLQRMFSNANDKQKAPTGPEDEIMPQQSASSPPIPTTQTSQDTPEVSELKRSQLYLEGQLSRLERAQNRIEQTYYTRLHTSYTNMINDHQRLIQGLEAQKVTPVDSTDWPAWRRKALITWGKDLEKLHEAIRFKFRVGR